MTMDAQPTPLVKCSVTGRQVPEDELVTFLGYRVCAEGKDILLCRLKAGDPVSGERERASMLLRFRCIFLDAVLMVIPVMIVSGLTMVVLAPMLDRASAPIFPFIPPIWVMGYLGVMHATAGQTLGKMAGRIVVVNADGSPLHVARAFRRALIFVAPTFLFAAAGAVEMLDLNTVGQYLAATLSITCCALYLCDIIVALTDRAKQRSMHDRICGTRVVLKD
jgi:uncharacterized RDD family membrane protein YckC